jgi:alkaline phosphatase D
MARMPGVWAENPRAAVAPPAPFTLGVASGDPLPDGVVLWTRLASEPLAGGGMPGRPVPVEWEVSADESFGRVVRRGVVTAEPSFAHSVHVEVGGLEPASWYFYRFRASGVVSPVGRTRTAPAGAANRLRLAVASCQHYEQGFYTAYAHMAAEDLDLVLHVGDYIYEGGARPGQPRRHNSAEVATLEEYRNRYALYKSDADLQAAHAAFPWVTTWDDHEVDNNYAGLIPENTRGPAQGSRAAFQARRAAAYQAYYEHLPLRRAQRPKGVDLRLYRSLAFGDLAHLQVLDTRQYRTDQPCRDGVKPACPAEFDPAATMTGTAQEQWLRDGLRSSHARWNVVPQQVVMFQRDFTAGPQRTFSMDKWDGYLAARDRILRFVAAQQIPNFIVLTGDDHAFWASDPRRDFNDTRSPIIGAEFVTTSISSQGDGSETTPEARTVLTENPHVRFHNARRGYLRCEATSTLWRTDIRAVDRVTVPGAPVTTKASFAVEAGHPGIARA